MRSFPRFPCGKFAPRPRRGTTGGAADGQNFFGMEPRRLHSKEIVPRSDLRRLVNCEQTRYLLSSGPRYKGESGPDG
jgi:hypothetical protein